jgi:phage baseplate assembly protein gpV
LFVNTSNEPINISTALKNTGNARLYCPLEDTDKEYRHFPDRAGTKYEFTIGAYEVLVVTE